jgi:hypothetical protein
MSRRQQPGQPSARALAAKQVYLELGPGRSLQRCLDVLHKRSQIAGTPPVCTRIETLQGWSSRDGWQAAALAWDRQQAQRRAQALAEEEHRLAQEDAKTLAATLRGATSVAAMILGQVVDTKTGELRRPAEVRDAVMLLALVLKGRQWLDARVPPAPEVEGGPSEIEIFLQTAGPDERMAMLRNMREMLAALEQHEQRSQY